MQIFEIAAAIWHTSAISARGSERDATPRKLPKLEKLVYVERIVD